MEKELLQQALNSILHGSTQIITSTDSYGNQQTQELRINDLRAPLIEKLAQKLTQTEEFKKALVSMFSSEVIKKMQENMLANVKYSDLPYDIKQKLEREMKEIKLEIKSYKLVAETITEKIN